MDQQTNGFDQTGRATATPPELDIPILRKQEKEKKGVGAVLPSVADAAGKAAMAGGGRAGGLLALLSGKLGLAALALGAAGAGAIGFGLMSGRQAAPAASGPQLDAPTSMVEVGRRDAYGSKSLAYMSQAGAGQLKWEAGNASQAAPAKDKAADAPADQPNVAKAEGAADQAGGDGAGDEKPRLAGSLSGAKLTSSLGGSSAFGAHSIFSGGTGFNMKKMDLKTSGLGTSKLNAAGRGSLGAMRRGTSAAGAGARNTSKIVSGKAMGQLKFAGNRSQSAATAGEAGSAATYAADAFDQARTNGGSLASTDAGGIGSGLGTVNPGGPGAPDVTGGNSGACPAGFTAADGGGCTPPGIDNGQAMTQYQGLLDGVLQMQKTAKMLMMIGGALVVAGAIIMATTSWMGIGTLIGGMMIAAGIALLAMGKMMNSQADQMANQIGDMYQQQKQADILKKRGAGDSSTPELQNQNVQQATQQEQGATYQQQ